MYDYQVDGQEIPSGGCGAQLSSNQFLLTGGRSCPTCAFVYNSDLGYDQWLMVWIMMITTTMIMMMSDIKQPPSWFWKNLSFLCIFVNLIRVNGVDQIYQNNTLLSSFTMLVLSDTWSRVGDMSVGRSSHGCTSYSSPEPGYVDSILKRSRFSVAPKDMVSWPHARYLLSSLKCVPAIPSKSMSSSRVFFASSKEDSFECNMFETFYSI